MSEDELVAVTVDLPRGPLRLLQPSEAAELPDDGPVEWAPLVPYWSVLWRSGVALAREIEACDLRGRRTIELGCGLAVPSMAASRGGARVVATDAEPDALALVTRNAEANALALETALLDWSGRPAPPAGAPFDLVLAADVLYERASVARLLDLIPQLSGEAWIADPDRPTCDVFLEAARERGWSIESWRRGVVRINRLRTE